MWERQSGSSTARDRKLGLGRFKKDEEWGARRMRRALRKLENIEKNERERVREREQESGREDSTCSENRQWTSGDLNAINMSEEDFIVAKNKRTWNLEKLKEREWEGDVEWRRERKLRTLKIRKNERRSRSLRGWLEIWNTGEREGAPERERDRDRDN